MPEKPVVDIVIPSWAPPGATDCDDLLRCLGSLSGSTQIAHSIHVCRSPDSASVNRNRALAGCEAEYVCFLDDDVYVAPGWLEALLDAARRDPARIVGPKIKLETGQLFAFGMHRAGHRFLPSAFGEWDSPERTETLSCDILPTTCMLVRRRAVLEVGGFDERFSTSQFEDIDFALRLKARGASFQVVGASTVYHAHRYRTVDPEANEQYLRSKWGLLPK